MNIKQTGPSDNYILANITKRSFNGKDIIYYGIDKSTNLYIVRFLVLLCTVLNASIDAYSSIMVIVLLKSYSKNINIRYSTLDGIIRFFTYIPAIVPWIKRNKMLSVYSSEGYLINTLVWSLLLYFFIHFCNWIQIRKIKDD